MEKNLAKIPKKRVSEVEKQLIFIKIEKLRLDRERSLLILNKGIAIYFAILLLAIIGFVNKLLSQAWFNTLVLFGILILIIALIPYTKTMKKEEDEIDKLIKNLGEG